MIESSKFGLVIHSRMWNVLAGGGAFVNGSNNLGLSMIGGAGLVVVVVNISPKGRRSSEGRGEGEHKLMGVKGDPLLLDVGIECPTFT